MDLLLNDFDILMAFCYLDSFSVLHGIMTRCHGSLHSITLDYPLKFLSFFGQGLPFSLNLPMMDVSAPLCHKTHMAMTKMVRMKAATT